MGAWSPAIYGNDLAEDLKGEYEVAFAYYNIDKALEVIEAYVSRECDLTDEYELCDYVYSLADYMWKKGILTEDVKQRALNLIESKVALEEWKESGELKARLKVLDALKERLLSPLPPKKKITIKYYTKPIFEVGDAVAFKLKTLDKIYDPEQNSYLKEIFKEEFETYNNKYVVLLKVEDCISYTSAIVPDVKDIWPRFKMYNKIFDELPTLDDLKKLDFVELKKRTMDSYYKTNLFWTSGTISHFKKRDYVIIGKDERILYLNGREQYFDLGRKSPWQNADSEIIMYIDKNNGRIFL